MSSTEKQEIPWGDIGEPLAELLRYEREIGYYEHAGYALLSTIVHETADSAWRQFLLADNNFVEVVGQVIAISDKESKNPKEVLGSIRALVHAAYAHAPKKAVLFLKTYLKYRPSFPDPIREKLDALSMGGKRRVILRATAFAAETERLRPFQPYSEIAAAVSEHWYQRILQGDITARQGRRIPARILTAKKRLLNHLRETEGDSQIDEEILFDRYVDVFKSTDILGLTGIIIGMHRFNLIQRFHVGFDMKQIELFLKNFPKAEVLSRFEKLEAVAGQIPQDKSRRHDINPTAY